MNSPNDIQTRLAGLLAEIEVLDNDAREDMRAATSSSERAAIYHDRRFHTETACEGLKSALEAVCAMSH